MARGRKEKNRIEVQDRIVYKCAKCSYVLYKKPGESPPTFCPNCAINHLRGEMIPEELS